MSHRESPFPMNIFLVLSLLLLLPVCHFSALHSSLGLFENKQPEGMYSGQWELQCRGRRKSRRNANKVDVAKPESWKKKKYFVCEIPDNCICNFVNLSISLTWWKNSGREMGPRVLCIHTPWKDYLFPTCSITNSGSYPEVIASVFPRLPAHLPLPTEHFLCLKSLLSS